MAYDPRFHTKSAQSAQQETTEKRDPFRVMAKHFNDMLAKPNGAAVLKTMFEQLAKNPTYASSVEAYKSSMPQAPEHKQGPGMSSGN